MTAPLAGWRTAAGVGLVLVAGFDGVSAIGGGIAMLLTDGLGMPRSMLAGSPFADFVWPALVLLVVVGGTQALAAALLLRRRRSAPAWAAVAGLVMMTWILVETAIIRGFSVLQGLYWVGGAAELVLVVALLMLGLAQARLDHRLVLGVPIERPRSSRPA
jgi:hypothetical protein